MKRFCIISCFLVFCGFLSFGQKDAIISGGYGLSALVDANGDVYVTGNNRIPNGIGVLGVGSSADYVVTWTKVTFPNSTVIQQMSCGGSHFVALDNTNKVWSWGENTYEQCGAGNSVQQSPMLIAGGVLSETGYEEDGKLTNVSVVCAGNANTFAILGEGQYQGMVVAWGGNGSEDYVTPLGDGTTEDSDTPVFCKDLDGNNVTRIVQIAAGDDVIMLLDEDGHVWTTGGLMRQTVLGRCASGGYAASASSEGSYSFGMVYVAEGEPLSNIVQIAAGAVNCQALDSDGYVWGWGDSWNAACGTGGVGGGHVNPKKVVAGSLNDYDTEGGYLLAKAIGAGQSSGFAISKTGKPVMWGIINGVNTSTEQPHYVAYSSNSSNVHDDVISLGYGSSAMFYRRSDGSVWAIGDNSYGALGTGNTSSLTYATRLNPPTLPDPCPAAFLSPKNVEVCSESVLATEPVTLDCGFNISSVSLMDAYEITWYKDGEQVSTGNASNDTYTATAIGTYKVTIEYVGTSGLDGYEPAEDEMAILAYEPEFAVDDNLHYCGDVAMVKVTPSKSTAEYTWYANQIGTTELGKSVGEEEITIDLSGVAPINGVGEKTIYVQETSMGSGLFLPEHISNWKNGTADNIYTASISNSYATGFSVNEPITLTSVSCYTNAYLFVAGNESATLTFTVYGAKTYNGGYIPNTSEEYGSFVGTKDVTSTNQNSEKLTATGSVSLPVGMYFIVPTNLERSDASVQFGLKRVSTSLPSTIVDNITGTILQFQSVANGSIPNVATSGYIFDITFTAGQKYCGIVPVTLSQDCPALPIEIIFDDCDDGDEITNTGGYWFTFNDKDNKSIACEPGTLSSITPYVDSDELFVITPAIMSESGYDGTGYAVHATYTLGTNYTPYSGNSCAPWVNPAYCGVGTQVGEDAASTVDWSAGTGISFWYKGSSSLFTVAISEVEDTDFHRYTVPECTEWTKFTVLWSELQQQSWGTEVTFSAKHIQKLMWEINTSYSGSEGSTGEIWIDDLRILGLDPVELTALTIQPVHDSDLALQNLSPNINPLAIPIASGAAGDTLYLETILTPTDATYPVVIWSSSDEEVVTVDSKGRVIGVSEGTATITARSKTYSEILATFSVEVKIPCTTPDAPTVVDATYCYGDTPQELSVLASPEGSLMWYEAATGSTVHVESSQDVIGGAKSMHGSSYTFDNGVQTMRQIGDKAANVVFCFQTIDENLETLDVFRFISGTESKNEIIKSQASETKFVMISDATQEEFETVDWSEGTTSIDIAKTLEAGQKAVAFKNALSEGFFEVVSYDEDAEDLTINVWTIEHAAPYNESTASTTAPMPNTEDVGKTTYYVSQIVNGCESEKTPITVTVNELPSVSISVDKDEVCLGETVTLTANVEDGDFAWSGGVTSTEKTVSFAPTETNSVSLKITNEFGCESEASTTITVKAIPEKPVAQSISYCQNAEAQILTATIDGEQKWYIGGEASTTAPVPNTATVGDTTYYVSQIVNGCESEKTAIKVTVSELPSVGITANKTEICAGETVTLTANAEDGDFAWSGGVTSTEKTVSFAPTETTSVSVTFTNESGCESEASTTIMVNAIPEKPVAQSVSYCQNAEAQILTAIADGKLKWYIGGEASATAPVPSTAAVGETTYYVSQIVNGCESEKTAVTVTISAVNIIATEIPKIEISDEEETLPTVDLSTYYTTETSSDITFTVTSSDPSIVDPVIRGDELEFVQYGDGTVTITVTATSGETVTSQSFTITVKPKPDQPTKPCELTVEPTITNVTCFGGEDGKIEVAVSGGAEPYTYKWNTGRTSKGIYAMAAGEYSILVRDSLGCTTTSTFTIEEPAEMSVSEEIINPSCGISNGSIAITIEGGTAPYTQRWYSGNGTIMESLENLQGDVYEVVIIDKNSCKLRKTYSLQESGAPSVSLKSVNASKCNEATGSCEIAVSSESEYTIVWSDATEATTEKSRSGMLPGTYTVTVNDAENCRSILSVTIPTETFRQPEIALVTVGEESGKNLVVWQKPETDMIAFYSVYREGDESGVYDKLGDVDFHETSIFVDPDANIMEQSWRYKISATDVCGNESPLSKEHKTIHLQKARGLDGEINLIWDSYEGIAYASYCLYRQTKSGSGLEMFKKVPASLNRYTDMNPPADVKGYYVAVVLPTEINENEPLKAESGPFALAISNIAEVENDGDIDAVDAVENDAVVYANGKNIVVLNANGKNVTINDITGRTIAQEKAVQSTVIPVQQVGVYLVTVGDKVQKVVVE